MGIQDVKKLYRKYHLPDFDKVNKELELCSIDIEEAIFLNALCRLAGEKMNRFIGAVSPFFIPNDYFAGVVIGALKDKDAIIKAKALYRELMIWYIESLKAELSNEKEQVRFFVAFWKKYPQWKEKVMELLITSQQVFQREERRFERGYWG